MDEKRDAESIRQLLTRSLDQIGQPVLVHLHGARQRALNRVAIRRVTSPVLAWGGEYPIRHAVPPRNGLYYWIGAMLLVAGLAYWRQASDSETSDADIDVDIAILTDDLSLQIYLD